MSNWINTRIEKASWRRFLLWLLFYAVFFIGAFILPGPWTHIVEKTQGALGVPQIPETVFGFVEGQPAQAFALLGDAINDYVLFQFIDIPYALVSTMMVSSGIALGLKRFNLGPSVFRFILLSPLLYLASEIIEDGLLASMASGILPVGSGTAMIQQTVTTVKLIADGIDSLALVIAIIASLIAAATKGLRRKNIG